MSEVAGDNDQLGPALEPVDGRNRALECPGAERIGRTVEADVGIAQLNEGEWCGRFAVELRERAGERLGPCAARERRKHAVKRADTERSSRDAQERSTIELSFHQIHLALISAFTGVDSGRRWKFPRLRRSRGRE